MAERLQAEVVVVGAGVVGLATAAALAPRAGSLVVLERHGRFGEETSGRSSEVVHAGLYYPEGSLKAALCLEGAELLLERAAGLRIPHRRLGKVVVASTADELGALEALHERARRAGARELELWSARRLAREEPRLSGAGALHSPRTAVVDSAELMRSFLVEAREAGALVAFRHSLVGLGRAPDGFVLEVDGPDGERLELRARAVVNAAGLDADLVAAMAGVDPAAAGYELRHCKGDWFSVRPGAARGISRLVYPLPEANERGLGVHLTFDVGGGARLGPDATYVARGSGYAVDESKAAAFLAAGRRLLPWLEPGDLAPERSGVRAKLAGPGEPARDFVVRDEADRGLPGLVSLVGIESPGLTASPAIARLVAKLLEEAGALPRERGRAGPSA